MGKHSNSALGTGRGQGKRVVPEQGKHLLYCDHIEGQGERFQLACKRDLEGIVSSASSTHTNAKWYKIRNRNYSQWAGREKLFEQERSTDPNWHSSNVCASASDQLVEAPPQ